MKLLGLRGECLMPDRLASVEGNSLPYCQIRLTKARNARSQSLPGILIFVVSAHAGVDGCFQRKLALFSR
jgi:hypothetical protein